MVYAFTVLVCLSLVTGVVGFHDDILQPGPGRLVARALFALLTLSWIACGLAPLAIQLLRRIRARPKPAG